VRSCFLDPTGDNKLTPLDILQVVNYVNLHATPAGEGEAADYDGAAMIDRATAGSVTTSTPDALARIVGPAGPRLPAPLASKSRLSTVPGIDRLCVGTVAFSRVCRPVPPAQHAQSGHDPTSRGGTIRGAQTGNRTTAESLTDSFGLEDTLVDVAEDVVEQIRMLRDISEGRAG